MSTNELLKDVIAFQRFPILDVDDDQAEHDKTLGVSCRCLRHAETEPGDDRIAPCWCNVLKESSAPPPWSLAS